MSGTHGNILVRFGGEPSVSPSALNFWSQIADEFPDWKNRKTDIGGPDVMYAYPYDFFGDVAYRNITLDYVLAYPYMADNITIADIMDIEGGTPLCYTYDTW